ncbi:hypothetical protein HanIR_Chr14g0690551 [Helianthus annuus]|nr:hypothetical protein HanIR_Chr14g0690551 [Helianthus annuus]
MALKNLMSKFSSEFTNSPSDVYHAALLKNSSFDSQTKCLEMSDSIKMTSLDAGMVRLSLATKL